MVTTRQSPQNAWSSPSAKIDVWLRLRGTQRKVFRHRIMYDSCTAEIFKTDRKGSRNPPKQLVNIGNFYYRIGANNRT